jgi:Tol biopolymer transport system component
VLVRIVDGSNEVVQVRLADAASRALTATPGVEETWPSWSEPAHALVYQARSDGGANDLLLFDPKQPEPRVLARTPRRDEQWPAWSPRRPQLVFAFRGGNPASGIALVDVGSPVLRLLASAGKRDFFLRPSFAPDGDALVAQRRGPNGRGSTLWRLHAGEAPRALTSDPAWFDMKPVYTRDGAEIVFSRRPAAGGPRDVVAIPAQGGAARLVAGEPASDDHSARPSPRRDEIVFVSNRSGRSALYLAPLSGGPASELGEDREHHRLAPRWSPDGERIVATVTPLAVGEPHLDEPEGLAQTRVVVLDREGRVLFDAPGFMPDWMPAWR